jgi:hypothetical protein
MSAVLKSPFDPYIQQILASPNYLSIDNARALLDAIRKVYPSLVQNASSANGKSLTPHELLSNTIQALHETIQRLSMAAATAEGGANAADLKKVVDAQEKQIKILAKLSETLTANERQDALENALIEALDETSDSALKERFLDKFHQKLGQKSQNLSGLA